MKARNFVKTSHWIFFKSNQIYIKKFLKKLFKLRILNRLSELSILNKNKWHNQICFSNKKTLSKAFPANALGSITVCDFSHVFPCEHFLEKFYISRENFLLIIYVLFFFKTFINFPNHILMWKSARNFSLSNNNCVSMHVRVTVPQQACSSFRSAIYVVFISSSFSWWCLSNVLSYIMIIILIFVFQLSPAPPLDGR